MSVTRAVVRHPLAVPIAAVMLVIGWPPFVAAETPPAHQPAPLATMLDTLEREPDPKLREGVFYRMLSGFDYGTVHVPDTTVAARFARVMARLMRSDTASTVAWQAAELMVRFPHPAACEALLEVAHRQDRRSTLARASALEALVALREPRALLLLEAELGRAGWSDVSRTLHLIAELGDVRGLAILREFERDSTLQDRLADSLRAHHTSEDRIARIATEEAAQYRATAARAERDLQRAVDDHIVSPFDLDDDTFKKLSRQGFAIRDEGGHELYEFLSPEYPCVTSDVVFHTFVLVVRGALGELDSLVVAPRLREFCAGMATACARTARRATQDSVRDAAWLDAAFFAVPLSLLGGQPVTKLPADIAPSVVGDVALIRAHAAPSRSAVLGGDEDFTKYAPRGRLSLSPELVGYAQAVTWLGRGNLSVDNRDALRRAVVMTAVVRSDARLARHWQELDALLADFYGPRDDLTFDDFARAATRLPDGGRDLVAVAANSRAITELGEVLASGPPPRINTGYAASWANWRGRSKMIGLRVLGQRYSRSADLFQQLLEHGVWPVSGLDVAAQLMGSAHAVTLPRPARRMVETSEGVGVPVELMQETGGLPEQTLSALKTLFHQDARSPAFMHQQAWEEKQINTALAGWAEVLNLTAPFVKDANMYQSASGMTDRFHGWVEPVPEFYLRLDSLAQGLASRLDGVGAFAAIDSSRVRALAAHPEPGASPRGSRGGEPSEDFKARYDSYTAHRLAAVRVSRTAFSDLSWILRRLAEISGRELRGQGQTIDDGVFLKSLRYRFKTFAFNVSNSDHAVEPMAVISDPATEYRSGQCLEVGTGRPRAIYVAVPDGNRTFVCRGGVYSYHEFTRPLDRRLDDATWRRMVESGDAPRPWMESRPALEATGAAPPAAGSRRH